MEGAFFILINIIWYSFIEKEVISINKKPVIFMFGGQGAQYYKMGFELYNMHPVFRYWMDRLDSFVSNSTGLSVLAYMYNNHKSLASEFCDITYTHPAIFMIQYSLARTLTEEGVKPDLLIGMSLGEYVSTAVAEAVEVESVLESILIQSKLIKSSCEKGGMLTIFSNVSLYDFSPQLNMSCSLVANNYDGHFVIAGKETSLSLAESWLNSNQIINQRLPVSYGFHTVQMETIKSTYIDHLKKMVYKSPTVPLLSPTIGDVCMNIDAYFMWQVIREPIRLNEVIEKLDPKREYIFLDLSPSGTLSAIVQKIQPSKTNSYFYSIITKFNQDALNLRHAIKGGLNELML